MPMEVEVFAGGETGKAWVMALQPDGRPYMTSEGSVDQDAIVAAVEDGRWDGGGW
jgi:hypothetical protein